MANKVLTIKMDEKDIERIKKCYKAFVDAGFFSAQTMSLNAFYKHLLLDYLEEDISNAFDVFSNYGIQPMCLNPNELGKNKMVSLENIYNFNDESYDIYINCVKEALVRRIDNMKDNAKVFNELIKEEIVITDGCMQHMEYMIIDDENDKENSFWSNKAFETMDLLDKNYQDKGIDGDIEIIQNSSISEDEKQKLINHIMEYEKKRKQNFCISQGRGIIK